MLFLSENKWERNTGKCMNDTLYIKADNCVRVTDRDISIGNIGEVWCSNPSVLARCKALRIARMKGTRQIFSIVDVVRVIEENIPQVTVSSVGEQDFVVEYKPLTHHSAVWEWSKFTVVWLVIFFGAAFAIATFNEDVSVLEVFSIVHKSITGQERTGFTWLECGYAAGLALGIMVFYNHLSRKKESSDPTPLDVEMRTYEKELYTTMIDSTQRQKRADDPVKNGGG